MSKINPEHLSITNFINIDPKDWDYFADNSDQAWLWHRSRCIKALNYWPQFENISFAVRDFNLGILAIVPVYIFNGRSLVSQGGPALRNDVEDNLRGKISKLIVKNFKEIAFSKKLVEIEYSISAMTKQQTPLTNFGFTDKSTNSWVIDLKQSMETIESGYSQLTRREIRKISKQNFIIREAGGDNDLDIYYKLHCETYDRTGVNPHPIQYFSEIFNYFIEEGLSRIVFLELDNNVLAAQNTAIYKKRAWYWTGASVSYKSGGENRVLFDNQIKFAKSAGCEFYETGEAFPNASSGKEKGLNDFKRSFGGKLQPLIRGVMKLDYPYFGIWRKPKTV
jgi:lipid II:glycine glycyltransferase (peptidoglycan interpeptide bridge formation enzyme)